MKAKQEMNATKTTEFKKGQTVFWWDEDDLQIVTARVEATGGRVYTSHINERGATEIQGHSTADEGLHTTKSDAMHEAMADIDRQIAVLQALRKSIAELHKTGES